MSDLLGIITSSDKRKRLLQLLQDGPKTIGEITSALDFTTTGMLPQIRILEERNLVKQENKKYVLTEIGKAIVKHLEPLLKTVDVIEKQEDFWQEHDAGAIPSRLLIKVGELGNTQIIQSGIEDIYEPHKEFLKNIEKSKKVMGISPIFHPVYPAFFLGAAEKKINISLILTRKVFDKIDKEHHDILARGLRFKNASLYISDVDIRLACVVTDVFFSISLFYKNGVFDSRKDLVSFDDSALAWGEELFNFYMERSQKIERS